MSNPKWSKQRDALKNEEDISESGRIFFRNLPYSTNEQELRDVFEKFGPIADVHLPIDGVTRIIKVNSFHFYSVVFSKVLNKKQILLCLNAIFRAQILSTKI